MAKKKFITCDGNQAASHIAYMFSEVACIYPITPSSTMAEYIDEWAAHGLKNMFGEEVKVVEMQSEAGAAGAVHGSLQSGALTSTFTASQGLLLMIPNMYKMSGELLPAVFHVSARTVAAHALSIFGDHSDIYATRQTGFAMLATGSIQEIMDLAGVAHLAAIRARVPFLHFFDGFRSSHEIQKIEEISIEDMKKLVDKDALAAFRQRALNPCKPVIRGTAQNPDIFFQAKEASNRFYTNLDDTVNEYMQKITQITGRTYKPFTYYGAPDAENIIIAMGSVTETIKEVIDYLAETKGEKLGLISVHLYRPFSAKYLFNVLPESVRRITVLDRTKEPGANGDPLYLDVKDVFYGKKNQPEIIGGRYGLSSKDTTPAQMISVFENMKKEKPMNQFTVGIVDDVTFRSLPQLPEINVSHKGTYSAKFYGIGSDGTVGANKNSIKIIGDTTDKYCQAYFAYDSKKSGGVTTSHLRFGDHPIRSPYLVNTPDFVACHVPVYLDKYDMLKGLKKGGTFLLNSIWDVEETKSKLPDHMKKYLAENNINFYIINATRIAEELGLGTRTNTIMQSAFFKVSEVIPYKLAVDEMKNAVITAYGRKGENVVKMNNDAIDRGGDVTRVEIPAEWAGIKVAEVKEETGKPAFIRDVVDVINGQRGDDLPVSAFVGREDGTFPSGTAAYEKRGIAVNVPEWQVDNCIQCNQCSYVCPHAAIRPFLLTDEELAAAPEGTVAKQGIGNTKGYKFKIQVSVYDCTGCGNCADVCPSKEKALIMKPLETQLAEADRWTYMHEKVGYKDTVVDKYANVKNSQFAQPLFEFSGACAGCGETPYIKAITQLFGDRMVIANATGCSSIYGGSVPSMPYTVNKNGHGPAWANSLFEDNAEYGLGIRLGATKIRDRIERLMKESLGNGLAPETVAAFNEWIAEKDNTKATRAVSEKVIAACEKDKAPVCREILGLKSYLVKKSFWVFGGDGWAYDIGYGGLDHVLASGENINVLVLDTEVYSNTGGQASKSTPAGAVAKFAASGKKIRKKDLGHMAMTYGYVYVAQVAMGSSQSQYLKAIREAEEYPGPSLIIAYSPCINHGLRKGMGKTQQQAKDAVEAGYWHLYRFDPRLEAEGKNPFQLDSKEPDWSKFQEFLKSEVRYTSLIKDFPGEAKVLFRQAEENAKWRYNNYKRLSLLEYGNTSAETETKTE
ncbi:MAG TPA: pyruvate:ferredoxin (flavodoxin) oxidoreductase [Bacteroidales bacterium]|jgi:pyruvate-ferredoxin/flavodoxin oxidoreductase|nr:pyruvate:ferredoxin (flavodoxin) oxidoreductase [Bacteroidales bacterium]HOH14191.1 pyruvate:ferredoxin (flavodoxin) oxidoreductase [Bacteroidales bacterium]HPH74450.1 pyruvate:ferredoxin (flavodoxin) oxidoreductase [Bacteroidales bacterium]HPO39199.1 pyruvate:ferredoxin (flavodoxin) oxidoreductase [Bacteroidales bacterium]HPV27251.1 pyruvate:ferredoxin (flavodoxin) oxidoreductase [Bacteroidales bacterium]